MAQANYSAANACLDALGSCLRARSQVAASVQWASWAEVGMAARGECEDFTNAISRASLQGRLPGAGIRLLASHAPPRMPRSQPVCEGGNEAGNSESDCAQYGWRGGAGGSTGGGEPGGGGGVGGVGEEPRAAAVPPPP